MLACIGACTLSDSDAQVARAAGSASGDTEAWNEEFRLAPDAANVRTGSAQQLEVQRPISIGLSLREPEVSRQPIRDRDSPTTISNPQGP